MTAHDPDDALHEALYEALDDGRLEDAERLLAAGADPNRSDPILGEGFLDVAWNGAGIAGVLLLVASGVDPSSLLLSTAGNDSPGALADLLDAGADPNFGDQDGWTALHRAAAYGYVDSVRVLLAGGADPNAMTALGLTAEDIASRNHHVEVCHLLVAHGHEPSEV